MKMRRLMRVPFIRTMPSLTPLPGSYFPLVLQPHRHLTTPPAPPSPSLLSSSTRVFRPLVVTSADRLDIVLGLLAAQLSVSGPGVAGILLTQAGSARSGRNYARDTIDRIFAGLSSSGLYKGSLLPVRQEGGRSCGARLRGLRRASGGLWVGGVGIFGAAVKVSAVNPTIPRLPCI